MRLTEEPSSWERPISELSIGDSLGSNAPAAAAVLMASLILSSVSSICLNPVSSFTISAFSTSHADFSARREMHSGSSVYSLLDWELPIAAHSCRCEISSCLPASLVRRDSLSSIRTTLASSSSLLRAFMTAHSSPSSLCCPSLSLI